MGLTKSLGNSRNQCVTYTFTFLDQVNFEDEMYFKGVELSRPIFYLF